jgi:hypothetical protein
MTALNLGTIRGALRTVINRVDGIVPEIANGESQSTYFPDPTTGAKATFDVIAVVPVHTDELREEYDEDLEIDGDTYEPDPEDPEARLGGIVHSLHGQRRLTVSIKVECYLQSDAATAWNLLERIRTRIQLPSSRATLSAAGAAISDLGTSRDLSFDDDTTNPPRRVSCAQFDLFLHATDSQTDDPVTTIEQVEGELNDGAPFTIP